MSIAEIQSDVGQIAAGYDFSPTKIPSELREVPAMDAIRMHLHAKVRDLGGFDILAKHLPMHGEKIWQNKIAGETRNSLMVDDFLALLKFFNDPVLIALLAQGSGFALIDLSRIPASDHSIADLVWSMRHYQGRMQILGCELRENTLDGVDTSEARSKLLGLSKELAIVIQQITICLNSKEAATAT